ncbi:MAG: hydrogenase maturation nickel metallochaperone HypA [archaeon]|nr:hydrogenase maturation nickel metallochaperone HypA [archaeon]
MHEFSMAQGILNAVLETAEENDANKVTDIVIQIGKLAMLNPEQLTFMLNVLIEDTIAENANIVIEDIDVEIKCYNCDYEGIGDVDDSDHYLPMILCPKCESHRVNVLNGKDVTIKNISIEKEDEDDE